MTAIRAYMLPPVSWILPVAVLCFSTRRDIVRRKLYYLVMVLFANLFSKGALLMSVYVCCVEGADNRNGRRGQHQPTLSLRMYAILAQTGRSCVEQSNNCTLRCKTTTKCPLFYLELDNHMCRLYRQHISSTDEESQQGNKESTGPFTWSHFLLAEHGSTGRILEVTTHRAGLVTNQYGVTRCRGVISMSCTSNGLFIITHTPSRIIFLPVNTDKIAGVRAGHYRDLVVDGKHDIIFAVTSYEVHRMTTHGRSLRIIAPAGHNTFRRLAVDSHNFLLFAIIDGPGKHQVISMSYSGDQMNVLAEGHGIRVMSFDVTSQVLVYSDSYYLMGYNVSSANYFRITKAEDCTGITTDRGMVYYVEKGTLMMYDDETGPRSLMKLKSGRWYTFCITC